VILTRVSLTHPPCDWAHEGGKDSVGDWRFDNEGSLKATVCDIIIVFLAGLTCTLCSKVTDSKICARG